MSKSFKYLLTFFVLCLTILSGCVDVSNDNKRPERYNNISSAPSYIKAIFRDVNTAEIIKMVIRNDDLASFLAKEQEVSLDMYPNFMIQNEGKVIDIDIVKFEKFVGKIHFGDESKGKEYLRNLVFDKAMTFDRLGVRDEKELIRKYFDFDYIKGFGMLKAEYYEKYTANPSFIALLIELNYDAVQGDIVPNLNIYKEGNR